MSKLTDEQLKAMLPAVTRLRELMQATERQKVLVLHMAAMVEPKVLEPDSGVSFNINTMEFEGAERKDDEPPESPAVAS